MPHNGNLMSPKTHFRRTYVRRQEERRSNPYAFNSPEWIAVMKENFELWPKTDRRMGERRSSDRRNVERRSSRRSQNATKYLRRPAEPELNDILADEERKMIMDLFRD